MAISLGEKRLAPFLEFITLVSQFKTRTALG